MKKNMRVRVYKTWHHDLASQVDVTVADLFN